jgi:transglutaminase-like putative cysteine protease
MWLGSLQHSNTAGRLPTKATLQGIPDGLPGATATLRIMRDLVRASIRDPAQRVRETALSITGGDTGWIGQIRAAQQWVQDNIRYVQDPYDDTGGVELVQTPQKTLDYQAGDCDDQSVLVSALLSSLGHPTRFIAIGFSGQPLSHVLVQTKVGSSGHDVKDWASVETIQPQPLGWFPPGVTSHYILKV